MKPETKEKLEFITNPLVVCLGIAYVVGIASMVDVMGLKAIAFGVGLPVAVFLPRLIFKSVFGEGGDSS